MTNVFLTIALPFFLLVAAAWLSFQIKKAKKEIIKAIKDEQEQTTEDRRD